MKPTTTTEELADINNMILIKDHFTFDDHNFVGLLAKITNGKTTAPLE